MGKLSKLQKLTAQLYGGGDYAHHETTEETQDVGDGLYTFLQRELDPAEGCKSAAVAIHRINSAIYDLNLIKAAIIQRETKR
jgi:hypothetical protein